MVLYFSCSFVKCYSCRLIFLFMFLNIVNNLRSIASTPMSHFRFELWGVRDGADLGFWQLVSCDVVINPETAEVGCCYLLPGLQLPCQLQHLHP